MMLVFAVFDCGDLDGLYAHHDLACARVQEKLKKYRELYPGEDWSGSLEIVPMTVHTE
jgi:hypothetical protein